MTTKTMPPTTPEGMTADDLMRAAGNALTNALDYMDRKLTRRVKRAIGEESEWDEEERPTLPTIPEVPEPPHR